MNDGLVAVRIANAAAIAQIGNAEGVRGHIDQDALDAVARETRGQHAGPESHTKIRVNVLARIESRALGE